MRPCFPAPTVAALQQVIREFRTPYAPKRPCSYPGCSILIDGGAGRCEKHRIQIQRELNQKRASAAAMGYGSKWRTARKEFLRRNPLCVKCTASGILRAATVVDHVVPHKGDSRLFWDQSNWQPLCKRCHDIKTVADGRWK